MASDYKAISEYNERKLGEDRASRMSQVAMYADTAHFIYELLQNADDVDAMEIHFSLKGNMLIVEHNGTLFSEQNVIKISYFGMGNTDITKIGHFGLGFKSVFAYTASPRVHSGNESFEISDLYTVTDAPYPNDLKSERTRFVLPFDHNIKKPDYIEHDKLKSPEKAYEEIAGKLANLGAETLLFTKTLKEIHWETEEDKGHYLRDDLQVSGGGHEIYILTGANEERCYLVFDKIIHWPDAKGIKRERRPIKAAFKLDKRLIEGGSIKEAENARLSVFFPTAMETHIGFILQGPYRTTPARDNVPPDDDFNLHLVDQTAQLLVDCLPRIKELNLLNLHALSVLPINYDRFREGTFYHPLYLAVREALRSQPFLPTAEGGFVCGMQAKLAYGAELTNAFGPLELEQLFDHPGLNWVNPELTRDNHPDLHRFMVGKKAQQPAYAQQAGWIVSPLAPEIEVDSKDIAKRITAEFMSNKSDDWVACFYSYLSGLNPGSLGHFLSRPIIRVEANEHVTPFGTDKSPNAFLPLDEDGEDLFNGFRIVKRTLVQREGVRQFLEQQIKLPIPNIVDFVLSTILPKYTGEEQIVSLETYKRDFKKIIMALNAESLGSDKKLILRKDLKNAKICLAHNAIDKSKMIHLKPTQVYLCTNDVNVYFEGNKDAYFLASDFYDEGDIRVLMQLGLSDVPRVEKREVDSNGNVDAAWWDSHGNHERGLDGFDPWSKLDGVEHAVKFPNLKRSQLLWQYSLPHRKCIHGVVEKSGRKNFERIDKREEKYSCSFGTPLIKFPWLPDGKGNFHLPADIGLDDLPEEFDKTSTQAIELAAKLGMRKPQEQEALALLVKGDAKKRWIVEQILHASGDELDKFEKLFPRNHPPAEFQSFRAGLEALHRSQRSEPAFHHLSQSGVNDPSRYQSRLDNETQRNIQEVRTQEGIIRFGLVRANTSNKDSREFLYSQYSGECQVTGQTFVKANGRNYFEAVSLVPRLDAEHLNHPGNMLCLSAETAAKFINANFAWVDDLTNKINQFRAEKDGGNIVDRQVRISLVGEELVITWTEQHFMRLISLWNHAS